MTWWNSSWSYRQKLTLATSQLSNDVTDDLPIMVKVDSSNTAFWNHVDSTGKDVRFVASDDTTALTYHFEKFDYSGQEMIAWVKVTDTFTSASDIDIYLYYGNSNAVDAQNEAGTYTANFKAVYHMADASGGITDSTSNNNDGTEGGTPTYQQAGQIGNCIDFDGSSDYFNLGAEILAGESNATVMFWANFDDVGVAESRPFGAQDAAVDNQFLIVAPRDSAGGYSAVMMINKVSGTLNPFFDTGDGVISNGTWTLITIVNSSTDGGKIYVNDVEKGSDADTAVVSTTGFNYFLGARNNAGTADQFYDGRFDEVKLLSTALSADAIKLLYLSESDSLITFGSEEAPAEVVKHFIDREHWIDRDRFQNFVDENHFIDGTLNKK